MTEQAPRLKKPDQVLVELADRLGVVGPPCEATYLSSRNPRHRWASESFAGIHEEFQYKAIWVAKQCRERFGPPDHLAYTSLAASRLVGIRAAAWPWGSVVLFVSLRRLGLGPSRRNPWLKVVLGALRPLPPDRGGFEGHEARAAVFLPGPQLVH